MLRIVSRSSRLALVQVREVMSCLPQIQYESVAVDTYGDFHKELSLLDGQRADFFTDTIDAALMSGEGDIAIHSAKDLPYPLRDGLELIALTECLDNTEALVTRTGARLDQLPTGARIATSSQSRKSNLLKMRSDLRTVSIRGNIEERIAQVDDGRVDALVVATCALKRLGLEERISEILPFPAHSLQGMLAVVARRGEPVCRAMFSTIDSRLKYGKVWLVGAGPGDPGLISVKGQDLLKSADIVYYDDLITDELLDLCAGRMVYVGKRSGRHSVEQEEINGYLYRSALEGNRVVRLKGGDPFIFGRGGEECDYLRERFVPVEVVPGISSVQGAAASLQIPLTHRHLSEELHIISGHRAKGQTYERGRTVAVFMGSSDKKAVVSALKQNGVGESDGVAVVTNTTKSDEVRRTVSLSALENDSGVSPLMILAGPAVTGRSLPRRILYTGLNADECTFDGTIVPYPLIRTEPIRGLKLDTRKYDGLVFTSRTAVEVFFSRFPCDLDRIYCIGPRTAQVVRLKGRMVSAVPDRADSAALNELLTFSEQKRILYPCSDISNNVIHKNPVVEAVPVYRTVMRSRAGVDLNGFDAVVFSSSSTVDSFFHIYKHWPKHLNAYVFGQFTYKKLIQSGVPGYVIITVSPGKSIYENRLQKIS